MKKREIWLALGILLLGTVVTLILSSIPFVLVGVACSPAPNFPDTPDCQPVVAKFAVVPIGLSALTIGGTAAVLAARKGVAATIVAAIIVGGCAGGLVAAYWFNLHS